ncbi:carbamoyl-phosphate synthase large subunit [Candidatus Sumerlaeota bacterium]|nr:carbamoyl-phosphate synthase large subunit [Candidatus Sumerlaeota bacterium]
MPKRTDIHKILIIGSGPIVIGQACEFDYSGTQGCKALREDGYEVVLVNSNPATIMTDPEFGDRTYIEPLTVETVAEIIAAERPDALLPTLGGQTGLNLAMDLHHAGVLDKYNVEMIGAKPDAIERAEDRLHFKETMERIGIDVPRSVVVKTLDEARRAAESLGYPNIVRPSYTLGGTGGGVAYNPEEFEEIVKRGLFLSPITEVMIEESVLGWKEYELEVMRDMADNVVIVCSIENVDSMGVHTGDSITVAPIQTLSDVEYQAMRDEAIRIIRAIGVDTGGSNIQFAVHPENGRRVAIEMNPRVSRSSALASKATGFPIAKIAAKLAVGYRLDELPNDITQKTPACFEPTIDYCVVKIPRFNFEKFPGADPTLGTQMKSVGETMAIGRTFKEALQKGLRGLEIGRHGLGADGKSVPPGSGNPTGIDRELLEGKLKTPNADRIFYVKYALVQGMSIDRVYALTAIDPWFLVNIADLIEMEREIENEIVPLLGNPTQHAEGTPLARRMRRAKQFGFSDFQIATIANRVLGPISPIGPMCPILSEMDIRKIRLALGVRAVYKCVDTCAGEFEAYTPYFYSTYDAAPYPWANEPKRSDKKRVIILGGGPNRIGQGIEFDYCCVQAVFALQKLGCEAIMVNSNPETVSTDYDTADKLYFEPLTVEDVLNICDQEQPDGVIVQFGGQTPLNLAKKLEAAGVPIVGTSPRSIELAEDRKFFSELLDSLEIPQTESGTGFTFEECRTVANRIGYPVMVRPSFVLGGRSMETVYDDETLERYMVEAVKVSPEHPILIDKFLEEAIEVDVDAVADTENVVIAAIMEHIELAGIHSGDSACVIPTHTLAPEILDTIRDYTRALGKALDVRGLMNIQYAVKDGRVYVLEVNPRASRTVPFVSKAIGRPVAQIATRVMTGMTLAEAGFTREVVIPHYAVKEAVLPFLKFQGARIALGPEMRSTGEVMGIDMDFGLAFIKSQQGAMGHFPTSGGVFVSVCDKDKPLIAPIARELVKLGFVLYATRGTQDFLAGQGVPAKKVFKVNEGRPNVVDLMIDGKLDLIVNTPLGRASMYDEAAIRANAVSRNVCLVTTLAAARAVVEGLQALRAQKPTTKALQDYHREIAR